MMKSRDETRKTIKSTKNQEKRVLQSKYKQLRNKVTEQIRKENIDYNNNRVEKAENKSELWKVTKEVTNPRKDKKWSLVINREKKSQMKIR